MYRELAESADNMTFTYVRGVSPADLVARWGGDIATFAPMNFKDVASTCFRGNRPTPFLAVAAIGDWTLAVDDRMIGVIPEIIQPLSVNTRVVSHYLQEITGIYEFRWVEDGRVEFGFYGEDGFVSGDPGLEGCPASITSTRTTSRRSTTATRSTRGSFSRRPVIRA